ncbi:MAG: glycosyltransferase [Pseudomonadota bacterium]
MSISIIIKALNEADRIQKAIESALAAAAPLGGEVILADSGSTDGTIEIAQKFPIRIVQLADWSERCCGIGPELGYRYATQPFIAITDGDMEMSPDFAPTSVNFLKAHPDYAGVSGQIDEQSLDQLEYKRRVVAKPSDMKPGDVDRLNSGGVFRRAAIEETGYLSDRNLHSYEEYDLAVRLREKGWKLHRLTDTFANHFGHRSNPYALLWRRVQTHYLFGIGELTRAHFGTPRFGMILNDLREIKLWTAIVGVWLLAIAAIVFAPDWPTAIACVALLALGPVPFMAFKYKSLKMGMYSVTAWHFFTYGFLRGILSSRRAPTGPIATQVIKEIDPPRSSATG